MFDEILSLSDRLTPAGPAPRAPASTGATLPDGGMGLLDGVLSLSSDLTPKAPKFAASTAGAGRGGGGMAPISYKDPIWDASEAKASKQSGVPAYVLQAIRMHGERSNGNQVSPKMAQGV